VDNVMLALIALRPVRRQCFVALERYADLRDEAVRLLGHVGLADRADAPVRMLGHGEQRQVEILLALAQRPALLLLDEPTAGLAPGDATLVTGMLRELPRSVTIVLIEHDMDVVFDIVERITVLHHGRVVAEDAAEAIRGHPTVQEIYFGGVL
jgi:branched-chain amino acid transport system ATP-binding protein